MLLSGRTSEGLEVTSQSQGQRSDLSLGKAKFTTVVLSSAYALQIWLTKAVTVKNKTSSHTEGGRLCTLSFV